MRERSKYLSVIIPVFNEEKNIPLLHENLSQVLRRQGISYEIICIDDGSTDGTFSQLRLLALRDPHTMVIRLRRNFGQTAAMAAGVDYSEGEVLVFMDGDLQNDPIDIPRLLAKLDEGYDVVSGWRKNRKDSHLSRKLPSRMANKLISGVTGVHLHDYGCTLKAYRWEVFRHIRLYGEMHRFLPAYAALVGAAITELEVTHHPRRFGVSKYGISRTVRVILDLITLKYLGSYGTRPLYVFGVPALLSILLGVVLTVGSLGQKSSPRSRITDTLPIVRYSGFGIQCIMMGLLAEVLLRTYYESQRKPIYVVKEVLSAHQLDTEDHLVTEIARSIAEGALPATIGQ